MERRLSVLYSHLHTGDRQSSNSSLVSLRNCSGDKGLLSSRALRDKDCIFCKIIHGESPAFKLYEDDVCLCILDGKPLTLGHSLIIPKSHHSSIEETPPAVIAAMCSRVPLLSNAIMKATDSDAFNLLVNSGAAAGQVIFHTHIHIIPRKAHDKLWTSESLRRRPLRLNQDTDELAGSIREHLPFQDRYVAGDSKEQRTKMAETSQT